MFPCVGRVPRDKIGMINILIFGSIKMSSISMHHNIMFTVAEPELHVKHFDSN